MVGLVEQSNAVILMISKDTIKVLSWENTCFLYLVHNLNIKGDVLEGTKFQVFLAFDLYLLQFAAIVKYQLHDNQQY